MQGVAEMLGTSFCYPFSLTRLYFLLHDKYFETNEEISNRIGESITIHRLA